VGHKNRDHFYFYDSVGKCGPILIILGYIRQKSPKYIIPPYLKYVATLPCDI